MVIYGLHDALLLRLADCELVGTLPRPSAHLPSIRLNRRRARRETTRAQGIQRKADRILHRSPPSY